MQQSLIGVSLYDTNGQKYTITKKIGEGSQGEVFETNLEHYIIKIVQVEATRRDAWLKRFKWIMKLNIPSSARLVTPSALLQEPYTGYVMRKVSGHESLNRYMTPPEDNSIGKWYNQDTGGLHKRIEIANQLSKSYRELHMQGVCYCDVSPNNVLVSPNKKSIALIDSDNLTATGVFDTSVLGTPRYIAPELFQQAKQPNSLTDTYSFAVLLFELFRLGHPFLGDAILDGDPDLEQEAFKGNAVYVEHPEDDSNYSSSILPKKAVLTKELDALLQLTFIEGKSNPMKRPTLYEFHLALQHAEDLLAQCSNPECGAHFFVEDGNTICPWCDKKEDELLRLDLFVLNTLKDEIFDNKLLKAPEKLTGSIMITNQAKALCLRHIEPYVSQEADKTIGVIKRTAKGDVVLLNNSEDYFALFNMKTRLKQDIKHREQTLVTLEDRILIKSIKNLPQLKNIFNEANVLNFGKLKKM